MRVALRLLAVLIACLVVASAWGQQSPATQSAASGILEALRPGGHVIVVRHGATYLDQADTDPLNFDNIPAQRQLTDKGRADAQAVGDVLRAAGVKIGKAYSSRYFRAVETARLIAGKEPQATLDVTEGGVIVSPNENARRALALRAMAAAPPDPGTNTLIVTHKPNLLDAFGKDWIDVREGEATIFKPGGSGAFILVARVEIDGWAKK